MGTKAASAIAKNRCENGEYSSVFDVCRIESHVINRKSMESLVQSGACDGLHGHRAQVFAVIDDAIRWGQKFNDEISSAQESLFDNENSVSTLPPPALPIVEEWSQDESLRREKETLGFYLSGDPLEKYKNDLHEFANIDLAQIPLEKPDKIKVGGIIRNVNNRYDKNNKPWAIVELNGGIGKADVFVFSEAFEKYKGLLENDACVFIKGSPSNRENDIRTLKIIADDIYPLSRVREKLSRQINILLTNDQNDANLLQKIKDISAENKGHCALMLHLRDENGNIKHIRANHISVNPDHNFIMNLRKLLGQKNVWIS